MRCLLHYKYPIPAGLADIVDGVDHQLVSARSDFEKGFECLVSHLVCCILNKYLRGRVGCPT